MSSEFNTESELSRVNKQIEATEAKLATLRKVKLGLVPERQLTKGMSPMTEKELCEKALLAIATNAHDSEFDLEKCAKEVQVSPFILSLILNRTFKRSFRKLLNDQRVKMASEMLGQYGITIKQVAYKCGYTDNHYFSRVFSAHMGVSPKNFVKMKRQVNEAAVISNQPDPQE